MRKQREENKKKKTGPSLAILILTIVLFCHYNYPIFNTSLMGNSCNWCKYFHSKYPSSSVSLHFVEQILNSCKENI